MNPVFLLSLALAASPTPSPKPPAQTQAAEPAGGGNLHLGQDSFRFTFESLNLAPAQPKLKLPRAFVLRGRLAPPSGTPLSFELTALEDGRIYGLRMIRKHGHPAEDYSWSATLKTRVEVLELDARPGGKLRLSLSGPLTTMEGSKSGSTTWKGELWGTFREVPR